MRLGIMQPYFFPYLGYFQLIAHVDKFVVYDNIEYTKKGFINRNRYLCQGSDKYFTIPLLKDSDFLDIRERKIATSFDRKKLLNKIEAAYGKAPCFSDVFPLFSECVNYKEDNLFDFIYFSLQKLLLYMEIDTELCISSTLGIGREKKGKEKVIAICKKVGADSYVNSIGGVTLYDKEDFLSQGITLSFLQMNTDVTYEQFNHKFVPNLSILDVLMFNSKEEVQTLLKQYLIH